MNTLQLATGIMFLLGSFYGDAVPSGASDSALGIATLERTVNHPLTLEEYVREYYKETPILADIAKCESRFRHLGRNGRVLRGQLASEDMGVMQINEFYHDDRAKALGLDLHTLDGNLAYAKWLYNKEGTAPWFASSKCWQKSDTLAKASMKTVTN